MKEPGLGVEIRRNAEVKLFPFSDYFVGFEKVAAVRSLFGAKTAEVLKNLKVEFFSLRFGYMSVSDEDGHILISTNHLKNADMKVVYLDVVHELFHVKQFMEGKKLFQNEFEYVDSPIEVPAYEFTVEEAKTDRNEHERDSRVPEGRMGDGGTTRPPREDARPVLDAGYLTFSKRPEGLRRAELEVPERRLQGCDRQGPFCPPRLRPCGA